MKKISFIVAGIVAAIFILSVAKDIVVKTSVEKGVEMVTGLRLNIGAFKVGVLKTLVHMRGLRLFNPSGFRDRMMLDMPEIYVEYDLPSIIKGKIYLPEARIDLKELVVVKNEKGELNLDSLKVVQAYKDGFKSQEKEKRKVPEIRIDKLRLKIGRVIYKDYTKGKAPYIIEYNVNIDEQYANIRDPYSLVSLIVVKSLANTNVASLANFDLQGLKSTIQATLATAQKIAAKTVTQTQEVAKKTVGEAAKKTGEAVKETANVLKEVFKNPLGSK